MLPLYIRAKEAVGSLPVVFFIDPLPYTSSRWLVKGGIIYEITGLGTFAPIWLYSGVRGQWLDWLYISKSTIIISTRGSSVCWY